MTNFDIPDSFSITDAFAALEEAEWIRLLRADGISVTPEKMDETDKTMLRNRFKKEPTNFYRLRYKDNDIDLGGVVITFDDHSITFAISKKKRFDKKTLTFISESPQIQSLLSDHRYLEQCNGDTNQILKSFIVHIFLKGRKAPASDLRSRKRGCL